MPTQLIHDPNDPSYKYKPVEIEETLVAQQPQFAETPMPDGRMGVPIDQLPQQQPVQEPLPTFTEEELLGMEKPAAAVPGNLQGETPEAETPSATPNGDELVSVVDPTTGQKIMMPASMLPPEQQPQVAATPDAKTPDTDQPKQTTPDSGQAQVVTTPSKHLYDYANNSLGSIMNTKDNNVPVRELLDDYFKWCQENGKTIDYITVNDIVNKTPDLSLSPIDNEKARKKAERKEKFDQLGNFLLHLGNAIGNVAGGNYASMKLEDPVQYTERQRRLKEKADQQRIANNQSIWAMMQKERADQRAQEIAKQNAEHQARMEKNAADRLEMDRKRYDALIENNKQKTADNTRLTDSKIELNKQTGEARITSANKPRATGGGRGSQYRETETNKTETDAKGNVLKKISTLRITRPYSKKANQSRGGLGGGLKALPRAKK